MHSFLRANPTVVTTEKELNQAVTDLKERDTIFIRGIICFEDAVIISKPLVLLGLDFPALDFQSRSSGLVLASDSIEVGGLHLHNIRKSSVDDYAAILVRDIKGVYIHHCHIYNAFFGIYLAKCQRIRLEDNYVEGNLGQEISSGNAIHLWQCAKATIKGNTLSRHRDGIYLEFVTDSHIESNKSFHNIRYGLHFMFSHRCTYMYNVFEQNEAGVAVMYSRNVQMIGNSFRDNWGDSSYGLLLKDIFDGEIRGNLLLNNTIAILVEGSNRLQVHDNSFTSNGWAIKISASCEGNVISNNQFNGNSFDVSTNGSTSNNLFDGNYWDHYAGYDLDGNEIGDVPHHPVSLFSVLVEKVPEALMLYRSFLTLLLDRSEHLMPSVTPSALVDNTPLMAPPIYPMPYATN
ncbi:MAG: nitrous oxide reductase family maturation protein NosD [Bacteroidetes bacterium]|nr:nitrous oxide reductase family maturation protein NosD [Bacteroidota bacterium]